MTIKSASIRYIILASDRWLSIPDDHDEQSGTILPSDDALNIVYVNVDAPPVEPPEDISETVKTSTQFNTNKVTAAQARQGLISVMKYVSSNCDIGTHHLDYLKCLLKAMDNYCAGIDNIGNIDSALNNYMEDEVLDVETNESFSGSVEVKIEKKTGIYPDHMDNYTGFNSDGGTDKMGEVKLVCDRTYVKDESSPEQINHKHKHTRHGTKEVKLKDRDVKENKPYSDANKLYMCKYCEKKCKSHNSMVEHIRKHTGHNEELFLQCDKCDQKFIHRTQLWRHSKQHVEVQTAKTFKDNNCSAHFDVEHKVMDIEQSLEESYCDSSETVNVEEFLEASDPYDDLSKHDINGCDNVKEAESDVQDDYTSVQVIKTQNKPSQNESKLRSENEASCSKIDGEHCDEHLASRDNIVKHMNRSNEKNVKYVMVCDKLTDKTISSRNKKKYHCDEKKCACAICGKSFITTGQRSMHMKRTHKSQHNCGYCSKTFVGEMTLNTHVRKKHSKEHGCDGDNKPVVDKLNIEKYVCAVCGSVIINKKSFLNHMLGHSGEKPYACEVCDMRFTLQQTLKKHSYTHTGARPYKCDICNKCFRASDTLVGHKRTHSGAKPFKCTICEKCFPYAAGLNAHMLRHTGEKPHQCSLCGKCFMDKSSWIHHTRIHRGKKLYSCTTCGDKLSNPRSLKRHMRHHDGVYSHVCNQCGKGYESRISLRHHILYSHQGVHPHTCDICGKGYVSLSAMKQHRMTKHANHLTSSVISDI